MGESPYSDIFSHPTLGWAGPFCCGWVALLRVAWIWAGSCNMSVLSIVVIYVGEGEEQQRSRISEFWFPSFAASKQFHQQRIRLHFGSIEIKREDEAAAAVK